MMEKLNYLLYGWSAAGLANPDGDAGNNSEGGDTYADGLKHHDADAAEPPIVEIHQPKDRPRLYLPLAKLKIRSNASA